MIVCTTFTTFSYKGLNHYQQQQQESVQNGKSDRQAASLKIDIIMHLY